MKNEKRTGEKIMAKLETDFDYEKAKRNLKAYYRNEIGELLEILTHYAKLYFELDKDDENDGTGTEADG